MAELRPFSPLAHRRDDTNPAETGNATVTVREVEGLGLLLLTVDIERHPHLRSIIETALGAALPRPGLPAAAVLTAIWQSPNDWLLAGPAQAVAEARTVLSPHLTGAPALLDDASHGLVVLELSGPAATIICPAPPGPRTREFRSAVGRFAGLRVTKLFDPTGTVRLFAEAADADYLWAWLADRMPALAAEAPA